MNFAGEAARVHSNACRHDDDAGRTVRRESKREEQLFTGETMCDTGSSIMMAIVNIYILDMAGKFNPSVVIRPLDRGVVNRINLPNL